MNIYQRRGPVIDQEWRVSVWRANRRRERMVKLIEIAFAAVLLLGLAGVLGAYYVNIIQGVN